jgi:hypothetical protein
MKRREFLMLASATAFAKQSLAEETKPTIGVLAAGVPSPEEFLESFREGLRDRGYIEGQNIQFDVQSAEGHADRLPELAAELVRRKVTVIIGFQTPSVTAAKQATTDIPIVMDAGDPVGMGIVQSLSKPGGNITGVSAATAEVGPKNLQLLTQIVPSVLIRLTPNHTKYDMELLKLPLLDSSTGICFSLAFPWKRGSPQVRSCCSWSSRHSGITPRRSIAGFGRRVGRCPMGWSLWTAG